MDQQLLDLYHRHVGIGFDRQLRMADYLARKAPGAAWDFEIETAVLAFGPKVKFEAPLVGSHAAHNDSWMWAWSNRNLKLSVTNRALGDTIRNLAHRVMVPEFARPAFPLQLLLGAELTGCATHLFGVVLAGELGYDAYYTAPYQGGRVLLLIRDDRLGLAERLPLARVLSIFPQLIATFPVLDHRAAFLSYVKAYGLAVFEEPGRVKVTGGSPGEVVAEFDERGRLARIEGTGITMPPRPRPVAPGKKAPVKVKKRPGKAAKPKPPVKAKLKSKPVRATATRKAKLATKSKPKPGKRR